MGKWLKHLLSMAFAKTPDKLLFTESKYGAFSKELWSLHRVFGFPLKKFLTIGKESG
jgi:hypothetical protein